MEEKERVRFVKEDSTMVTIKLSRAMDDEIERLVQTDMHSSKSEFIRDAVRKEIERLKKP